VEATGKILGWVFLAAVVYVALKGHLGTYVSLLGA